MADETAGPIHPVILSGGAGTRLWPLSRAHYPKQLLPLMTEHSLLQETALRVSDGGLFAEPLLVCNEEHRFIVAEQVRAVGRKPSAILLEPAGRNTAPAVAAAALALGGGADLMLVLPSDHAIPDREAFLEAVRAAAPAAMAGCLVTFGIAPTRPETGFGYLRRGEALPGLAGVFRVDRFVEKPDAARAAQFLAAGDHLWNGGMFLFRADRYLEELARHRPDMMEPCRAAVAGAKADLDFLRLDAAAFARCPADSIDYAVMERTADAALVPLDAGWSDVGSWDALWTLGEKDEAGNVRRGDVAALDVRESYLRSEGPLVAAIGLEGAVVVATRDVVLVAPRGRAQDVKMLVDGLARQGRSEASAHPKVYRPWGSYEGVDAGDHFQVKHITVTPGHRLSLQRHRHRAEHWIVVSGVARVTRGDEMFELRANESTFIPLGAVHRLENAGTEPLHLIEVQSGAYLGEDDIERLDDSYGRG